VTVPFLDVVTATEAIVGRIELLTAAVLAAAPSGG
jgi:hypothetical protein